MQSKDFFSLIKEFPHSFSLFLTYTLEKEVIQKIREHSSGRTVIIHDYRQGVSLDENFESRLICLPALLESNSFNLFHAKIAVLKGEDRFRVLVGSMNLTRSSFSKSPEVCLHIDIFPDSVFYCELIKFLFSIKFPKSVKMNFMDELISQQSGKKKSETEEIKFIYNDYRSSICENIFKVFGNLPNNSVIKIASPFMSKDLSEKFDDFINKLNPKNIELYTRASSKIPKKLKALNNKIKIFEPDKKYTKLGFHAKLMSIDYGSRIILIVGSANFTQQGFFSSTMENGNQECGVILDIRNPIDIKQVNDWFTKGWMKPCSPEEWQAAEENDSEREYEQEPYAFAFREGKNGNVEIFIPNENNNNVNIIINSKKYVAIKNSDGLYSIIIKNIGEKTENLLIKINQHKLLKVKIFDPDRFDKWKKYDGDGLFNFTDSRLESLDIREMSNSISKEGIKSGQGKYIVVEPPKLEQFYQNVRYECESILKKKFFTKSHLIELENVLSKLEGGTGVYAAMQFLKTFSIVEKKLNILLKDFKEKCMMSLKTNILQMEKGDKSFNRFLNQWLKINAN